MKSWAKKQKGFTIVELLIVIVVIAILAAVTIVAYNGIQQRARDSKRQADANTIIKALEIYHADNGGYPTCNNTTYVSGGPLLACNLSSIASSLVPKYIGSLPADPINTGQSLYKYAAGFRKTSSNAYSGDASDNYIIGMHMETVSGNVNPGWVSPNYYNYLGGSSN